MIQVEKVSKGAIIWLDRPEKRNALNAVLINQLMETLTDIRKMEDIRYLILRGKGKAFSAGADLEWMKNSAIKSKEENYEDAVFLAKIFHEIYHYPKPIISVIHGSAFGGAIGLISASDIAVCTDEATFAFSEVKLGLVPATISPFVIRRTGEFFAKEYMLTGKKFHGQEAARIKLVNKSLPERELEEYINGLLNELNTSSPQALKTCKKLINQVVNDYRDEVITERTAEIIADIRTSKEALEGLQSFLDRRRPNWVE